jgi:hypothetical protein
LHSECADKPDYHIARAFRRQTENHQYPHVLQSHGFPLGDTLQQTSHALAKIEARVSQPKLPQSLIDKANKIGDITAIMKLKSHLSQLRGGATNYGKNITNESSATLPRKSYEALELAEKLRVLKTNLELHATDEQLSRTFLRLQRAELVSLYLKAQANAKAKAKQLTRTKKHKAVERATGRAAKRVAAAVLADFIDMLFPETIIFAEGPTEEQMTIRNAAVQEFNNWRKLGKPFHSLITRFGLGIILLLPDDLSNEE